MFKTHSYTSVFEYLGSFEGVSYASFELPVARLYLFGNEGSLKLAAFAPDIEAVTAGGSTPPFPQKKSKSVSAALAFLEGYMRGKPGPMPACDLDIFTPKEKAVYRALIKVPFGGTVSYGELAARSGVPGGGRFVGNAMAKNMFPVFIPCHRVIKSDGAMGYYSGGVHIKEFLLAHELGNKK